MTRAAPRSGRATPAPCPDGPRASRGVRVLPAAAEPEAAGRAATTGRARPPAPSAARWTWAAPASAQKARPDRASAPRGPLPNPGPGLEAADPARPGPDRTTVLEPPGPGLAAAQEPPAPARAAARGPLAPARTAVQGPPNPGRAPAREPPGSGLAVAGEPPGSGPIVAREPPEPGRGVLDRRRTAAREPPDPARAPARRTRPDAGRAAVPVRPPGPDRAVAPDPPPGSGMATVATRSCPALVAASRVGPAALRRANGHGPDLRAGRTGREEVPATGCSAPVCHSNPVACGTRAVVWRARRSGRYGPRRPGRRPRRPGRLRPPNRSRTAARPVRPARSRTVARRDHVATRPGPASQGARARSGHGRRAWPACHPAPAG